MHANQQKLHLGEDKLDGSRSEQTLLYLMGDCQNHVQKMKTDKTTHQPPRDERNNEQHLHQSKADRTFKYHMHKQTGQT